MREAFGRDFDKLQFTDFQISLGTSRRFYVDRTESLRSWITGKFARARPHLNLGSAPVSLRAVGSR